MRHNSTALGAMLVELGKADSLLCGLVGPYGSHLKELRKVMKVKDGEIPATVNGLILLIGNYLSLIPLLTQIQLQKN